MKLRMLNGSHSFLAYLGYLAGYEHIADCMQDSEFKQAAYNLMINEQAPTLSIGDQVDLQAYAQSLIERYTNPNIKHRTWQIAMDGSQKLPQRMLESVSWHITHQSEYPYLALAIAAWIKYVGGIDEKGQKIDVRDPKAEELYNRFHSCNNEVARVRILLDMPSIFGNELPAECQFVDAVTQAYQRLELIGAKKSVSELIQATL